MRRFGATRVVGRAMLVAALFAIAPSACRRAASADAVAAVPVTIQVARSDTFRDVINADGTIVPSAISDLTVYAPEAATIAELPKKEQDTVEVGDVLVRFDIRTIASELAVKQLAVLDATTRFNQAKTNADRQLALATQGLVPRAQGDAAKTAADAAASMLAGAQADLDAAKAQSARATVTAKFPGVVVHVWHAVGDAVNGTTTDPVLRVVDPTHLQALLDIRGDAAARVTQGMNVTVRSTAGDVTAPGNIVVRGGDPPAPGREIRVAFFAPTTFAMDTPVRAEILVGQQPGAIAVPATAVMKDDGGTYVMVAADDGRAHRREVHVGATTNGAAQLSAGLTAGERVIVSGLGDVTEGSPVTTSP